MEQKKVYEQPASETVIIAPEQGMLIQTSNRGAGFGGDPEEEELPC
jgi:hypothetical protein